MRRVFLIGEKDAIASDPDGPKSLTAYSDALHLGDADVIAADPRAAPAPCGLKVGQRFNDELLGRFRVVATNRCEQSDRSVKCSSNYLPAPYSKVFISLQYTNVSARLTKLEVSVTHREADGSKTPSILEEGDREWYNGLYKTLREMSYCQ